MKFLLLLFLFPLTLFGQKNQPLPKDLAGVWTGYMYNDTTQQTNDFELAISENGKKLSGYTYTIFLIDGKKNIGIKSVKIKTRKELLLIEDEKLIDNNYDDPPAKGVRTFIELHYTENDTAEILTGSWKTNITRQYNSVTGNIFLSRNKEQEETAIIPKLRLLNLWDTVRLSVDNSKNSAQQNVIAENEKKIAVIVKNENEASQTEKIIPDTTITNPEITIYMFPKKNLAAKNAEGTEENKNVLTYTGENRNVKKDTLISLDGRNELEKTKQEIAIAETGKSASVKNSASDVAIPKSVAVLGTNKNQREKVKSADLIKKKETVMLNPVLAGNNETIKDPYTAELLTAKSKTAIGTDKLQRVDAIRSDKRNEIVVLPDPGDKKETQQIISQSNLVPEKRTEDISQLALLSKEKELAVKTKSPKLITEEMLSAREITTIRTVEIERDTLIFSLFDNGVIDGDTVSVLLNGEVIMSKIGLLDRAYNDTIYLTPEMGDSIHIILYAENLGSIPPNTGLLVVREGKMNHEIRFSGDLKKNSAIILKRKRQIINGK